MRTYLLAGVLLLAGCGALQQVPLDRVPLESLGRIGAAGLPMGPENERVVGRAIAEVVAGRYPLLEDPELNRYVNLVGQAVAQQSVRGGEVEFHFGVLDTDDVNAFAAPGGYIFITRGALALMESEADLAGVLAHEIAHVDQQHVLNEIRRSAMVQQARDEAALRGPLLDQISEFGSSVLFSGLSREDEMAADSLAIVYAAAVGYRPDGLLRFLTRLQEASEQLPESQLQELRATHPSTEERLAALHEQLASAGLDPERGQLLAERFRRYVRLE